MTREERDSLLAIVTRHIPREWREDIRVDLVSSLRSDNGRPAGTAYAQISARSKLGRAQAMFSIGPYVSNDPSEWSTGWQRGEDGRWTFIAYDPSADPQQPTIADLVAQAESNASSNS